MGKNKFHILVVDDDDKIRSLIKQFLSEKGFVVSSAENAENAKLILDVVLEVFTSIGMNFFPNLWTINTSQP